MNPQTGSIIDSTAIIKPSASIGRFCIIEDGVTIEEDVVIDDYVVIRSTATIGPRTRIGPYSQVGRSARLGGDCSLTAYCEVRDRCVLGDRVIMGSRCTLSAGTVVENDVTMKYLFVTTDTPDLTRNNEKSVGRIGAGSRFGASVVVMPGVNIGPNAEIGASSQVRADVPANEVWFGIPAKFYRRLSAEEA